MDRKRAPVTQGRRIQALLLVGADIRCHLRTLFSHDRDRTDLAFERYDQRQRTEHHLNFILRQCRDRVRATFEGNQGTGQAITF